MITGYIYIYIYIYITTHNCDKEQLIGKNRIPEAEPIPGSALHYKNLSFYKFFFYRFLVFFIGF